jgi:hypothetical protein
MTLFAFLELIFLEIYEKFSKIRIFNMKIENHIFPSPNENLK